MKQTHQLATLLATAFALASLNAQAQFDVLIVPEGASVTVKDKQFRRVINHGRLTMAHCEVGPNYYDDAGAGIYNAGRLFMRHSTIQDCFGYEIGGGGGLYNRRGASASLDHCLVTRNHAAGDGGAILNEGDLYLSHCQLLGNSVWHGAGGMANYGRAIVTKSLIADNSGTGGGGIENAGDLLLVKSQVTQNRGYNFNSNGPATGGLYNYDGAWALLIKSEVFGNTAEFYYGIPSPTPDLLGPNIFIGK